jgi:hypothetical protein
VVFPGNLQGRHARETGPKGCELVHVNGAGIEARFVPLHVVCWHQVEVDLRQAATLDALPALVGRHLAEATGEGGDCLHAVRVRLVGETPLHGLEARQPGTLAAAVRAAAQDVASAEIWIEQVRLELRSPVDRARLAQANDALGELVRGVDALASDPQALASFCRQALGDVLAKMPAEVQAALLHEGAGSDVPGLDDPAALLALVQDAEATLLARLAGQEARA